MSLLQPQYVPSHAKSRYLKHASYQNTCPMGSLAVDPALLYAKLEVAKLEQDAARKAAKSRKTRTKQESQYEIEARPSVQGQQERRRESVRRSLPVESEWTADGKPCFNTAQILAALGPSPPLRHGSRMNKERTADLRRQPEAGSGVDSENDVVPGMDGPKARRRFRNDDTASKLIAIKHGSQTTYERIDLPASGLIEDTELLENQEDDMITRPKLSKYDRPHWAQQSQNASEMHLLKHVLPGLKPRKAEVAAKLPGEDVEERGAAASARHSNHTSDTLIADAVREIKREQRLKKLHTVSNLFKRSSD